MTRMMLLAIALLAGLALASAARESDQSQIGQMFDQLKDQVLGRNNTHHQHHHQDRHTFQAESVSQGDEDPIDPQTEAMNVRQQMDYYGRQLSSATSSCPSIELSDCSGMQIHLRIDNSHTHQAFRGLRFANKSGLVISQTINTSKDCPAPQINMRNTSGTRIFITDDSLTNDNTAAAAAAGLLQATGNRCPNISMRDCSGMDISIRIDNVNCPVPRQSPGYTNSGSLDTDINMKDCSGIKIFMLVNSS